MSYLTIDALKVGYGNQLVIDGLNLQLAQGKITALIGPNGCGKSTLLKTIARIIQPQAGSVRLQGENVHQLESRALARQMALLPQAPVTPEGVTVRDLVGYGRAPWISRWGQLSDADKTVVDDALRETHLMELADRPATDLSGGQRQRAWIAMILAQQTELVLLDEPTTWLDIAHQVELLKLLRKLNTAGKTVVVVLHDLNQACRYCDELVVLRDGALQAHGTPNEVFTSELVQQVFDLPAQIAADPVSGTPMCLPL